MTPDRKKPSAALWITVALLAVLVGYPLSFAGTIALAAFGLLPDRGRDIAKIVFYPLIRIIERNFTG
jgi:hypothetical protein